jgi:hypothetical protein
LLPAAGQGVAALHARLQAVAELGARHGLHRDAARFQEAPHLRAHRVHAGLVVGAAVRVHHLAQRVEHRVLLRTEPLDDQRLGVAALPWENSYSTLPMRRTARARRALSSRKNAANASPSLWSSVLPEAEPPAATRRPAPPPPGRAQPLQHRRAGPAARHTPVQM